MSKGATAMVGAGVMSKGATAMVGAGVVGGGGIGAMVLIDGAVRGDLCVLEMEAAGPCDERVVTIGVARERGGWDPRERERVSDLEGRRLTVVQPVLLEGIEAAGRVLFVGRVAAVRQRLDGKRDGYELRGVCDWSGLLEGVVEGAIDSGERVGDVIVRLSDGAGLGLDVGLVGAGVLGRVVGRSWGAGAELGAVLRWLLDRHGLVVRREMSWDGGGVIERRGVRELARGRDVSVVVSEGAVAGVDDDIERGRAVKMVGVCGGQVVESTFEMVAGWDVAGEGLADGEYARSTSGAFEDVADVYRLWVLNEDGALGGAAYDLTGLFGDGRAVEPTGLRFGGALSADASGRSLGVVVEYSDDNGLSWRLYPGRVANERGRAGVYLDDDVLDGDYFASAKAGGVRVRVTATLTNPLRTEVVRWAGHPFAGGHATRAFDLRGLFAWRRVDSGSKYFGEIEAGLRPADETDGRGAMRRWLDERAPVMGVDQAKLSVVLDGLVLGAGVGDRVTVGLDGERVDGGARVVRRVTWDWDRMRTEVGLEGIGRRV